MSTRSRIAWFGLAGLLVIAGAACAAVVSDGTGEILAFVLIALGLVLATSLVFLEVGLSEDRERAAAARRAGRFRRGRLGRSRGHRRTIGRE